MGQPDTEGLAVGWAVWVGAFGQRQRSLVCCSRKEREQLPACHAADLLRCRPLSLRCSFLSTEAASLELEPPAELAPADRARLQKYAAATAVRWAAACAASGGGGGGNADS